jgi:predicted MFS family arabinose efflux permease
MGATVLAHSAFNGTRLTISLNALALGGSPLVVGMMMSLFAALPMFLGIPGGRLVDRVGVRMPLLASVAVIALGVSVPAAFPGIASLYVAAAVVGTAFMLFHIAMQHAVGEGSAVHERKENFGWLALAFSISNFIGPSASGLAIDALGHRATFGLLTGSALAAVLLLVPRRHWFTHTPDAPRKHRGGSALDLLREAELRRVFIATGILGSAWDLFVFAMPIYGTLTLGLSATTIGLVLSAFAAATFIVRMALPWISRHMREWSTITATMVVAAVAYGLFPVVSTVPLLAALAFLLGLGLGATQPSIMSLLYAKAPEGRAGEAVGLRSVILNASHTALPLAFGGVGAALGMLPVFWSMATLLLAGAAGANHRRLAERDR